MQRIHIGPEEAGCRVDRLLRKRLALLPLSGIYRLIRKGGVRINGRKANADYRPAEGEVLEIDVDEAEIIYRQAPDLSLAKLRGTSFFAKNFSIIYEDDHMLACNKTPGLVVHPGTGHTHRDSLIELAVSYLLDKKSIVSGDEAALVHRLDRDTSGVILIAKNKRTLRLLHKSFLSREVEKEYRAVCHNRPPDLKGTISLNLFRTGGKEDGMKMRVDNRGRASVSRYSVTAYSNGLSSIEVFLDTGKTHQIRVHMAHIGAPVVGDLRYGDCTADNKLFGGPPPRLFLHAYRISFRHPYTNRPITIKAPIPSEFSEIMKQRL